jgi:hypothetical protein
MNPDTIQGYACWAVAATLAAIVVVIIVASILNWTT